MSRIDGKYQKQRDDQQAHPQVHHFGGKQGVGEGGLFFIKEQVINAGVEQPENGTQQDADDWKYGWSLDQFQYALHVAPGGKPPTLLLFVLTVGVVWRESIIAICHFIKPDAFNQKNVLLITDQSLSYLVYLP